MDEKTSAEDSEEVGEGDSRQEVPATEGDSKTETPTAAETKTQEKIRPVVDKLSNKEELTAEEQAVYDANTEAVDNAVEVKNLESGLESVEETEAPKVEEPVESTSKLREEVVKQAERAKKAISKILPNVEIVLHETSEEFGNAIEDSSAKFGGMYMTHADGSKKIHINLAAPDRRTVAHEVFHAVILNSFKSNGLTTDLTNKKGYG